MIFDLFTSKRKAGYYKLSFYDGFATQQNKAMIGSLLFEKFYSIRKLNNFVSKQVEPFGRYLLACLIVTKYDCNGEIIAEFNYFEIAAQNIDTFEPKMVDDDINYLSEPLYSKPA